MFDCHVHSSFSSDSTLDAVAGCEAAIKAGLDGIAFTDHLDFDFPGYENDFMIDFEAHGNYMTGLKEKYNGKLKVLKGIEVGIQPGTLERTLAVVNSHEFDYILGSVHIIDGMDPYVGGYYTGKTKEQPYSRYLKEISAMLDGFTALDCLAHLDYIIRCSDYDDSTLRYADFAEILDEIFKKLSHRGKGMEVNTRSYLPRSNGKKQAEFDIEILKRFRELGGEIVCLGSDSHTAETIGWRFDYFSELIKVAGFTHAVYFIGHKPVFYKL